MGIIRKEFEENGKEYLSHYLFFFVMCDKWTHYPLLEWNKIIIYQSYDHTIIREIFPYKSKPFNLNKIYILNT